MEPISQLDRIEGTVTKLWARVDLLERRASVWGAVGGMLTALAAQLGGCL